MTDYRQVLGYSILGNRGMEDTAIKGHIAQNMNQDFIRRIAEAKVNLANAIPFNQAERNPDQYATHYMGDQDGYMFPTVSRINPRNQLEFVPRSSPLPEEINMKHPAVAAWLAQNYKRANPEGFNLPDEDGNESSLSILGRYLRR